MTEREYCVTQWLPNDGEKVLCFGHKTFCCTEDMDQEPAWHEVTFKLIVSWYKLKKEIPNDPEESIILEHSIFEQWKIEHEGTHIIGVTKWKRLPEAPDERA